jgi:hypothetical protein
MTDLAAPAEIRVAMDAEIRRSPLQLAEVIDYLLVTTYDHGGRTPAGFAGPVEVGGDVRIERLDDELAERLLRASELRGENWDPARQFHVVHAYVRQAWSRDDGRELGELYPWDADGRLYPCVQLSRLVRDNGTSTEHAVRRLIQAGGGERLVPFSGFDSHVAYRLYPERPGWLDVDEAHALDALVRAYWDGPALPERVGRAVRRVDSVTRERYLEDALPLVVGGLESLLKTVREFARAQFAQRVSALARTVGLELSETDCGDLYDDRSALVQGAGIDLSQPHERGTFEQGFIGLQETLRRAVRRAVEEPDFAATFASDAQITAQWPVTVTDRGRSRTI